MKLNIYILVDNVASSNCRAEHGLSYLIDYGKQVLFDVGQSDLFASNAQTMHLNLDDVKTVVLSHGHYDHGNGLAHVSDKALICHPNVFSQRYSGKAKKYVGLNQNEEEVSERLDIKFSKKAYSINDDIVFLGEIPRVHSFEKHATSFYLEDGSEDELLDDSAIAIKLPQGLFIVSGCAHAGICNIISHAMDVTVINKVFGIMGGFHLKHNNKQTKQTIEFIKSLGVEVVIPSHCTGFSALNEFYQNFSFEQVKAGSFYTFNAESKI